MPVGGGRIEQLLATPAQMISYAPDGSFFLYQDQKGFEDEWRKHHTSSVTRDVWMYDVVSGKHKSSRVMFIGTFTGDALPDLVYISPSYVNTNVPFLP